MRRGSPWRARTARKANSANTAGNANTVDGQDASDFAAAGSEAWQPLTFSDGGHGPNACFWDNADDVNRNAAAYFRDSAGVVHLKGYVKAVDGIWITCSLLSD